LHAADRETFAMNMPLVKAEPPTIMPAASRKIVPLEPKRQAFATRLASRARSLATRVVPPIVVIALTLLIWELLCRRRLDPAAAVPRAQRHLGADRRSVF
jgi:nitrate/nitrite transport system permease protein